MSSGKIDPLDERLIQALSEASDGGDPRPLQRLIEEHPELEARKHAMVRIVGDLESISREYQRDLAESGKSADSRFEQRAKEQMRAKLQSAPGKSRTRRGWRALAALFLGVGLAWWWFMAESSGTGGSTVDPGTRYLGPPGSLVFTFHDVPAGTLRWNSVTGANHYDLTASVRGKVVGEMRGWVALEWSLSGPAEESAQAAGAVDWAIIARDINGTAIARGSASQSWP